MRNAVCFSMIFLFLGILIAGCPPENPVPPTASFTAAIDRLTAAFTDASDPGSADITAWVWDFGDGETSTEQNPTHTYAASGTYTVSLTVTTTVGSHTETWDNGIIVKAVFFVIAGATGDGTSWNSPLGNIQEAVDAAVTTTGGEIWVAEGTYTAGSDPVVLLQPGVALYGGFAGTETSRDNRDVEIHPAIIDGEGARRCIHGADDAILDGFFIQKGFTEGNGAGMFNNAASPAVNRCKFLNNTAGGEGGGMYNNACAPEVIHCLFAGNSAGAGGGIGNVNASPTVSACTFAANRSALSPGIYNTGSSAPFLTGCSFGSNIERVMLPDNVPLDLIACSAGAFFMGSPDTEEGRYGNETQHQVTLTRGFSMGMYEITKRQWQAVMGTSPWSDWPDYILDEPESPAVCISWDDAQDFAEALSDHTDMEFRLPTSAEWEYACRAGSQTRYYWGEDPSYMLIGYGRYAWFEANARFGGAQYAHIVGLMLPNAWGLYDMSGNVSEWCQDYWHVNSAHPETDPTGPASGTDRISRGGSWYTGAQYCRSANKRNDHPTYYDHALGFRIVRSD
ncbi:MAG TPA: SUMF1/EgtB/PvdO family nonheme iron enzyme [Candidatus Hydrogenedentes bacterium]|nr:SUMF1/EgtB/PvdO family nonheme iron enzyme [Candidatus Hydrogenedentota bacterium]